MARLLVIDVVALARDQVGADTPHLAELATAGFAAPLAPNLPADTCSVQASMLTGALPRDHGIVGNGWYFRDLAEVFFWRQSNALVQAPAVWDAARRDRGGLTVAKLFVLRPRNHLILRRLAIYEIDGEGILIQ